MEFEWISTPRKEWLFGPRHYKIIDIEDTCVDRIGELASWALVLERKSTGKCRCDNKGSIRRGISGRRLEDEESMWVDIYSKHRGLDSNFFNK